MSNNPDYLFSDFFEEMFDFVIPFWYDDFCQGDTETMTKEVAMRTKHMTDKMQEAWDNVEEAIEDAHLVAFDGCHKIYLAMDEVEAKWFADNYNGTNCDDRTFRGTPEEMLAMVEEWYNESCALKFVQAVSHNEENPNAGYVSLVDQGLEDENDPCEDCGYSDCSGGCDDEEEDDEDDE
jgi:hypothetical protein